MTTYQGVALKVLGGPDPGIVRGGMGTFTVASGPKAGTWDGQGPTAQGVLLEMLARNVTGRHDPLGPVVLARVLDAFRATVTGDWAGKGPRLIGRFIPVSTVYRNSDRITMTGIAVDLAGVPLRVVQLQFIGLTVQSHFFGSSTDANGIYVAYLEVGDAYTAYAYSPSTGIVWQLDHEDVQPNTHGLIFRQITRRAGFGEGLFLQGSA